MKKKIMMMMCAMMLILLVGNTSGFAMSFSELYRNSDMKAFFKTGELLFGCRNKMEQTYELICTEADGQILWKTEIPRGLYANGKLGISGDDIAYVYRTEEGLFFNRYSKTGSLLTTYELPKDAGMYILRNDHVYFISERKIKFCDTNGRVMQLPTDKDGRYKSLYEAEGNGLDIVLHVSVEGEKKDEHELIAFDSNHEKRWTYPLKDYDLITAGRTHLAVSSDGCTSLAICNEENAVLNVTTIDGRGSVMWTREISLEKGSVISLIKRDDNGTTWIWGATQISSSDGNSGSWKIVIDSKGNTVERTVYPKWIDFISYLDGAPYAVEDPFGVPVLYKEEEINWIIQ